MKAKKTINKAASDQKKIFRIPTAKQTAWHRDKSKYRRRPKHRGNGYE
jgi:hypothetical protein